MSYEILASNIFDQWLVSIKSIKYRARNIKRFDHTEAGNFGDHKSIDGELSELRFSLNQAIGFYYTIQGIHVVLLLCGGDKSSQKKDIKKAKLMINELR